MDINLPKLEKSGSWSFVGQTIGKLQLESLKEIGEYCFLQCTFNNDVEFSSLIKVGKGCFAGSTINANFIFPKLTEFPKNFAFAVQIKEGNYIQIGNHKYYSFNELVSKLNFDLDQIEINNDIKIQKNK